MLGMDKFLHESSGQFQLKFSVFDIGGYVILTMGDGKIGQADQREILMRGLNYRTVRAFFRGPCATACFKITP